MPYKLAPSILSADFAVLGEEIRTVDNAGAHYIHFDVMDGHFVPNISFGLPVLRGIRPLTSRVFDVHLMMTNPYRYLEPFAKAGADILNVHVEAADDVVACLDHIHALGKKAAVTLKPCTPVSAVLPVLEHVDMVLLMSVEPGFGGQAFQPESLRKAEELSHHIRQRGLCVDIEMDGGIDLHNVTAVLEAGVNVVVAGSAVFAGTPAKTAAQVRAFLDMFHEQATAAYNEEVCKLPYHGAKETRL